MSLLDRSRSRLLRLFRGRTLEVWYHPDYRLPLTTVEARGHLEPRRADLAAWFLLEQGAVDRISLREPAPCSWAQIARVHPLEELEARTRAPELARIFSVEEWDLRPAEIWRTVRLGVGGTVGATLAALEKGGPQLNLLGGFHHAGPRSAGGFCLVNDLAIAVAEARAGGFTGQVAVLDLDAHPPDGTAACFVGDPTVWVGSISGANWGPLPGEVDETVLPQGSGDEPYLAALEALLSRAPEPALAFVLAGGDVLKGDPLSPLGLSEAGIRARDLSVDRWLGERPAVWLAAGGYGAGSWRALAGTGLALAMRDRRPVPHREDPLRREYARISRELRREELEGEALLTEADLAEALGIRPMAPSRFLAFYTLPGLELALQRYGITGAVSRLGYRDLHVEIDRSGAGDRARLLSGRGAEAMLLAELVLARQRLETPLAGEPDLPEVLFVHWLTLRHPLAATKVGRPLLPGQDLPGLGLAREFSEILRRIATRLGLAGVAIRPAWFHIAYASRRDFRFVNPEIQGRFEALIRDMAPLNLVEATVAVAEGRARLNGVPWAWDPGEMLALPGAGDLDGAEWAAARDAARDAARFSWG